MEIEVNENISTQLLKTNRGTTISNERNQLNSCQSSKLRLLNDPISKANGKLYGSYGIQKDNGVVVSQSKWYAIYTKSRFEMKLYQALQNSGFSVFLPLIKEKRIWSDRVKSVTIPLLPSYLFIKLPKNQNHLIYCYPGFVKFVKFEGKCCEINEKEIGLLKNIERYGLNAETNKNNYHTGDLVRVIKGPLVGCEGKIDRTKGSRVIFQLDSIHQCVSVELCSDFIERIK